MTLLLYKGFLIVIKTSPTWLRDFFKSLSTFTKLLLVALKMIYHSRHSPFHGKKCYVPRVRLRDLNNRHI